MNIQEDSIDHEEFISPKDYINRFIEILEAQVAELKEFAASNPHIIRANLLQLIRANLLQPTSDDVAKKFRAKIFNIFHLTGPFIDRNSADAVRTDTRIAIKKDFESKKIPLFTTVRGR